MNPSSPDTPEAPGAEPDSAEPSGPVEALPPSIRIAVLRASAPWHWLLRGARDLRAHAGIALFYGLCFWAMAQVLGLVFRNRPEYAMSVVSGCLLVGPFLAMGLYDVSRRRGRGQTPTLGASLICWRPHLGSMGLLVLVLAVLELLWGRASLVVFAVFFNTGMPSTTGVVQAIFNPGNWEFVLVYLAVGGVFATLVFSTMVVSMPMILDRDTDAISAAITSLRVVSDNVGVMLLWGVLIVVLIGLALASPWGLGLLVLGPLLGHASWHAYCSAVQGPEFESETEPDA